LRKAFFDEALCHKNTNGHYIVKSSTYCIKDDPTVGLSIWEADDKADFDKKFEPHKKYYADVLEITPVIPAEESKKILMEQMAGVK
jgi:hypothetical protein